MDERLMRKEGETDFEYYQRIGLMKLSKEIDLEWDELAEICAIGESGTHYRKKMYGVKETTEYYEEKIDKIYDDFYRELKEVKKEVDKEIEDKRLKEIDKKILNLKVEKQKLKDERNFVNAQVRLIARVEHLTECVADKIEELNMTRPLITEEVICNESGLDAVMLTSDIHMGADTDNILDKYNPEICIAKMNYYVNKCIKRINKEEPEIIHWLFGGDLISGLIHTTTRFSNRLDIADQVDYVGELVAEAIAKVRKETKIPMKIAILSGNHDRIVAEKNQHIEEENFVKFIDKFVRLRLKDDDGIEFYDQEDVTLIDMEIRGHKCVLVHGDKDREKTLDRLIELKGDIYDYIFMGHYHKYEIKQRNHTTIIYNGAFGGEDYARNSRLYNKPEQLLLFFDDYGIDSEHPINLDNYKK